MVDGCQETWDLRKKIELDDQGTYSGEANSDALAELDLGGEIIVSNAGRGESFEGECLANISSDDRIPAIYLGLC